MGCSQAAGEGSGQRTSVLVLSPRVPVLHARGLGFGKVG